MLDKFLKGFSKAAQKKGITQINYYAEETKGSECAVCRQKPERMVVYERMAVFIEGNVQGLRGTAYTELMEEACFDELILRILETAEENQVPFESKAIPESGERQDPPETWEEENCKRDLPILLDAEAAARSDARIKHVQCAVYHKFRRICLANQDGAMARDDQMCKGAAVYVVAREGERTQAGRIGRISSEISKADVNLVDMAAEAGDRAVTMLHSKSLTTGRCQVILDGSVVREMLSIYITAFYGQSLLDNKSMLKGKKGKRIASSCISLTEEPAGVLARSFDDEGQICHRKEIIQKGILESWLHNLKSAAAMGDGAAGNGYKKGYQEDTSTGYTNLILQQGEQSLETVFAKMGDGLYITDCDGMFAGANPVSGDFSLISKGYRIEGGKRGQAVGQIAIAGNFFEMLEQIKMLADDSRTERFDTSTVTAPSLWAGKLFLSGREK